MDELVRLLTEQQLTISSVESFTVGKFGSGIGSVPGASKVYTGSVISYATRIKHLVVHVEEDLIERFGVVSKEVARSMCVHGKEVLDSDLCISFTGNAGPTVMEDKPVGLVYIGINILDEVEIYELRLEGSRKEIVEQAIAFAKDKILVKLRNNG